MIEINRGSRCGTSWSRLSKIWSWLKTDLSIESHVQCTVYYCRDEIELQERLRIPGIRTPDIILKWKIDWRGCLHLREQMNLEQLSSYVYWKVHQVHISLMLRFRKFWTVVVYRKSLSNEFGRGEVGFEHRIENQLFLVWCSRYI